MARRASFGNLAPANSLTTLADTHIPTLAHAGRWTHQNQNRNALRQKPPRSPSTSLTVELLGVALVVLVPVDAVADVVQVPTRRQHRLVASAGDLMEIEKKKGKHICSLLVTRRKGAGLSKNTETDRNGGKTELGKYYFYLLMQKLYFK